MNKIDQSSNEFINFNEFIKFLENSSDAIVKIDKNQNLLFKNNAFDKYFIDEKKINLLKKFLKKIQALERNFDNDFTFNLDEEKSKFIIRKLYTEFKENLSTTFIIKQIVELEKTEIKYKDVLEGIKDAVIYTNKKGKVLAVNSNFEKILQIKKEEVIGKNATILAKNFLNVKNAKIALTFIKEALLGNYDNEFEIDYNDKILLINTSFTNDSPGITGLIKDITEQRLNEQTIFESKEKYRALYNNAPLAYQSLDKNGNIVDVNPKWLDTLGYQKSEVLGKWFGKFLCKEYVELFKANFLALKKNGIIQGVEFFLVSKSGEKIFVSFEGCVGYNKDGTMHQIYCTFKNITEQIKIERQLNKQQKRNAALLENAPDGLVVLNENGEFIFASPTALKRFNYKESDLFKYNPSELIHPDDLPKVLDTLSNLKNNESDSIPIIEYRFLHKNGNWIWIESTFSKYYEDKKQFIIINFRDISERKITELVIHKQEAKMKSIFSSAPVGIGVVVDRVIVEANDRLVEITGYTRDELLNKNAKILYPNIEEYNKVGEIKYEQIKKHGTGSVETIFKRKDGTNINILLSSTPIDLKDHSKGVTFSVLDITKRIAIKEALKENEAKFKSYFNSNPTATFVFEYDKDDFVNVDINDTSLKQTKGKASELIGVKASDNYKDLPEMLDLLKRCRDTKETFSHEMYYKSRVLENNEYMRFTFAHIEPNKILLYAEIITDQVKLQKELEKSNLDLNLAQNIASVGNWQYDPVTNTPTWSDQIHDIFEQNLKLEYTGRDQYKEMYDKENTKVFVEANINAIKYGKPYDIRLNFTSKKGNNKWIRAICQPDKEKGPKGHFLRGTIQEITELVKNERALKESEEKWKSIYASMPGGTLLINSNNKIENANDLACELLGFTKEELEGKDCQTICYNYPNDCPLTFKNIKQIDNLESAVITKKGKLIPVLKSCRRIQFQNKDFIIDNFHDISELKKAENELQEKNSFIQTVLDNLPIGVAMNKMNERVATYQNKKFEEIYGWSANEIKNIDDFFSKIYPDKNYRENLVKQINEDIASKDSSKMHWENIIVTQKDGTKKIINAVNIPLYDQNTMVSTVIDVTEHKKAEQETKEREEKFKSLFNQLSDSIFIHDYNGNIVEVNDSACYSTGYTKDKLLSMNIADIDDSVRKMKDPRDLTKQLPVQFESTGRNKDGSLVPIEVNLSNYSYSDRRLLMAVVRDISQRKKADKKLAELTTHLKLSLQSGDIGTWEWDIQTNKLDWDDRMYNMYGQNKKNRLNNYEYWKSSIHPDDIEKTEKELNDAISGIKEFDSEFRIVNKKKQERYIRAFALITRNNKGEAIKMTGINYDITEQKIKNEQLAETLEMYRTLIEQNQDAIFLMNKKGNYIDVNKQACELLGYEYEELVGLSYKKIIPFEMLKDSENKLSGLLRGEKFSLYEKAFLKKDGTKVPVEISVSRINDQNDEIKYILTIVRDISERKEIERKKKINEQRLESLFKISQFKIGDIEELLEEIIEGVLKITKSEFASFYEYAESTNKLELLCRSKNSKLLFKTENTAPENNFEDISIWQRAIQMKKPITINNYNIQHPWLKDFSQNNDQLKRLAIIPISINNIVIGILGLANKIELYEDLDIEQATLFMRSAWNVYEKQKFREEVIRAKNKAEESDKLKSAFLANMSHEIRTPMNGIVGFAQILKQKNLSEKQKEKFINIIISGSNQLLGIINDIIDISKIESGQIDVIKRPFKVNELLNETKEFFDPQCKEKGIELLISNTKAITIESDRMKISQILNNLISNAIKFTLKGSIVIDYKILNNNIILSVKDSGIGIAKRDLEIIFERFRQADDSSTRKYGGTGLGLAITKAFSQILGGHVWVESKLHEGSTFYIKLPTNIEDIEDTVVEVHEEFDIKYDWKHKLILIAEDEDANYLYLHELLSETNATLIRAINGKEALKKFETERPDIILMDIKMPVMNGYEATKRIRKIDKHVPIFAQTAYALSEDVNKSLNAGCNIHISKPIEQQKLLNLINQYFNA